MLKTFKIGALFDIHSTNANSATTTASATGVQREFKNYRITDYFVVRNTHSIPKEEVRFGGSRPYVTAGSSGNSVAGYIDYDESLLEEGNSIMIGGKTTVVTYQPYDYFSNDSHNLAVFPKNSAGRTELAQLFIASALQKSLGAKYSWGDSVSYRKIQKDVVSLPAASDGEPDFAYMEERIAELDAYLIASGLDDYELTEEDKGILSLSPESASDEAGASEADHGNGQVVFKAFAMHDIFEPLKVTKAKKSQLSKVRTEEFCVPVVYAKFGDNGIMYWGKKGEFTTYENVISIVYNGVISAGKVYAQEEPTGILAESYLIRYKYGTVPFLANLYMSQVIEHRIYPLYSRENLATWNGRVENETIELPVTADDNIDFDYMERYIRAIEKLAIANVVKYKDKLIATTRRVVGA